MRSHIGKLVNMSITLVGVNHRTAPVEVRERLTWPQREQSAVLKRICDGGASGVVLLSTCNRVEFYLADASARALEIMRGVAEARLGEPLDAHAYTHRDDAAVSHLFRVTSGLDSMVLGECEIQSQVRAAWEMSRHHAGVTLTRLFQFALQVGGRVRSETALSTGAASVPSASVGMARRILGDLAGRTALVMGAGEMAQLALGCLAGEGVRTLVVAHRNLERARALAGRFGGRAVGYDDAWPLVAGVDLLLCSSAAPEPVVTAERIEASISRRGDRPLCILDIAVPRDVAPEVGRLANVHLYDIDDLEAVAAQNVDARQLEVPAAERIVQHELDVFWEWYRGRAVVETIKSLRRRLDAVRAAEVRDALRRLDHLAPEDAQQVEHLTRALLNKFLHEPTRRLRTAAGNGSARELVEALEYLFHLDPPGLEKGKENE